MGKWLLFLATCGLLPYLQASETCDILLMDAPLDDKQGGNYMGKYRRTKADIDGMPVFKLIRRFEQLSKSQERKAERARKKAFMYYYGAVGMWYVGPVVGGAGNYLAVKSDASIPTKISEQWYVHDFDSGGYDAAKVTIRCMLHGEKLRSWTHHPTIAPTTAPTKEVERNGGTAVKVDYVSQPPNFVFTKLKKKGNLALDLKKSWGINIIATAPPSMTFPPSPFPTSIPTLVPTPAPTGHPTSAPTPAPDPTEILQVGVQLTCRITARNTSNLPAMSRLLFSDHHNIAFCGDVASAAGSPSKNVAVADVHEIYAQILGVWPRTMTGISISCVVMIAKRFCNENGEEFCKPKNLLSQMRGAGFAEFLMRRLGSDEFAEIPNFSHKYSVSVLEPTLEQSVMRQYHLIADAKAFYQREKARMEKERLALQQQAEHTHKRRIRISREKVKEEEQEEEAERENFVGVALICFGSIAIVAKLVTQVQLAYQVSLEDSKDQATAAETQPLRKSPPVVPPSPDEVRKALAAAESRINSAVREAAETGTNTIEKSQLGTGTLNGPVTISTASQPPKAESEDDDEAI